MCMSTLPCWDDAGDAGTAQPAHTAMVSPGDGNVPWPRLAPLQKPDVGTGTVWGGQRWFYSLSLPRAAGRASFSTNNNQIAGDVLNWAHECPASKNNPSTAWAAAKCFKQLFLSQHEDTWVVMEPPGVNPKPPKTFRLDLSQGKLLEHPSLL